LNARVAYTKKWREDHAERVRSYHTKYQRSETYRQRRLERNRLRTAFFRWLKDQPCTDCHEEFPHYCMDFDHARGEKFMNVTTMDTQSWDRIQEELRKCDVVCAICHRKRTYVRQQALRRVR
jgi:hypothetical protein